ncbi:SDR family oxidoreductase [Nitrolancea hollandica]|uniref:2,5-dichloro-2,5-cyclohexadiene-1,4-diol dehydrogenase n=1 Tax=Nitrolancea hollandica Lb TaxID=1129897 RepID=I4EJG2_9BACT|nr:SDR family oxidoreductase [Nitrolancea hollandica]CCF84824.1 2,5-dichloro-2,5-cyclohexadiene-1,4-diol dehydrogenase [Nitrolancea hollandica Lb]
MAGRLMEKVALVTGAGSGIGRASALAFAREGAKVVVSDISIEGGEATGQMIRAAGGEATFAQADVAQAGDVAMLIDTAVHRYGRLDCAFNNAGIESPSAATADVTEEVWNRTLAVNLTGVWLCMKYELAQMLRQESGVIVNCSSVAGLVGYRGSAAYVASKHGIIGLTKTAALDYAQAGIRVNAVCPGVIQTPMIERFTGGSPAAKAELIAMEPMGRLGTADEVADAVLWLCSPAASFVTGHALVVDGGFVAQ